MLRLPRAESKSARISAVVPVSPRRGKIRVTLLKCASAFMSVIASIGERDIVAVLIGLTRGRFDARAAGDAEDDDLSDVPRLQIVVEIRIHEGAPGALRNPMIARLRIQLGHEIGPSRRKIRDAARLLGAARREAVNIDQHDRKALGAESLGQGAGALQDFSDRMHCRQRDDAFLQIDDDERGFRIESGDGHGLPFGFWDDSIWALSKGSGLAAAPLPREPIVKGRPGGKIPAFAGAAELAFPLDGGPF